MHGIERLKRYFLDGAEACPLGERIGVEVETSFLTDRVAPFFGAPVTPKMSQGIFSALVESGWLVRVMKGKLIAELERDGSKILYDLGRQNIELAAAPAVPVDAVRRVKELLSELYAAATAVGAYPYFKPILHTDQDLLVVPDERDAIWVELDGRAPLNLLARSSALQFTVDVSPDDAIPTINRLLAQRNSFLEAYPNEKMWREYIHRSAAGYRHSRYGGPTEFVDIDDYCVKLAEHAVVSGGRLVPFAEADGFDVTLFLRSVWWYFRLRRYAKRLCIEVRPIPRRTDHHIAADLAFVMDIMAG